MKRAVPEPLLVVVGYALLTAVVFWPLPVAPSTLMYNPANGDAQFSVWNVAWVAHALLTQPTQVFDANIFYPHRWTLAYSEMNLAAGAIAAPAYLLTRNAFAAHNVALLSSFVLAGTAMYYLARELTNDRRAAAVAGIIFAFCPHVFGHLPHIQLLMTAGLPLSLLAFHRLVERPDPVRGAWLGLAMAAQAYACGYYSVFVLLMVGFAALVMAWRRGLWRKTAYWTALASGAAVAILASAPLVVGAEVLQRSGFERTLEGSRQYVADWRAYLASGNLLHAWMLFYLGSWKEVLFPGFLAIGFGSAGLIVCWRAGGRRRDVAVLYGGLAIAAFWISFGPDGGLYTLLYHIVPMFSMMRAPSRFGLVVVFSLAVLASFAIAALLRHVREPGVVASVLIAAALGEALVPIQFQPVPQPDPAYHVLAAQPYGPVLELPVYSPRLAFRRARYMLDSTVHWMPLVDAYSDYIPPDFEERAEALADFPSLTSLREMKKDAVRYAVVHTAPYTGDMRRELFERIDEFAPYLRPLYKGDEVLLFEVVRYP